MKKVSLAFVFFAVIFAVGGAVFLWSRYDPIGALSDRLPGITQRAGDLRDRTVETASRIQKEVLTPPPLRSDANAPDAFLSVQGTFEATNAQRSANGRAALRLDEKLNEAARKKVQDMFDRQYFAHDSPTGEGPSDLADEVGYDYITVGENLALGNFEHDAELVQAWMDSPGHRANILHEGFTEVGIAVGEGLFEGQRTWLAVQEFGKPLSDCPSVDGTLKTRIDANNELIASLAAQLETSQQELDAMAEPKNRPQQERYNEKVREHNALVDRYNGVVTETKGMVSAYNLQVAQFNACAGA